MISPTDEGFTDQDIVVLSAHGFGQLSNASGMDAAFHTSDNTPFTFGTGTGPEASSSFLASRVPCLYDYARRSRKGKGISLDTGRNRHFQGTSERQREELAYKLLASLPRSRLAGIQRRIAPLLHFDLVGSLPTEISLKILSYLPSFSLLTCALVCRRWRVLADDSSVWRSLCEERGWAWRSDTSSALRGSKREDGMPRGRVRGEEGDEDEGMGDEEEGEDEGSDEDVSEVLEVHGADEGQEIEMDSGFMSMNAENSSMHGMLADLTPTTTPTPSRPSTPSTPRALPSFITPISQSKLAVTKDPDYKLLHQTHTLLHSRIRRGLYRVRTLQGAEAGGHSTAIYCLWLWTYPSATASPPLQVLFTGSKDRTVREWDLRTGLVRRVLGGIHESSVLSLCVASCKIPNSNGTLEETSLLVSAGSDRRVVVWDLCAGKLVRALQDHEDSVLCVRIEGGRLVTCSKDRTIRTYAFPSLVPQFVFRAHRAAVNAVSVVGDIIVSGSGDRSVRVWDANKGTLVKTFEDHHARGIASIEFRPPFLLSGSSDRHLRMFDIATSKGWSTCPEFDNPATEDPPEDDASNLSGQWPQILGGPSNIQHQHQTDQHSLTTPCEACGHVPSVSSVVPAPNRNEPRGSHSNLVRSVALGDQFAVSGSYDSTVKVWDRKTGALVADLTGGHTGRIFSIGFDCTKIVSCGEDQRICIWDFSHGIDTSFIKL